MDVDAHSGVASQPPVNMQIDTTSHSDYYHGALKALQLLAQKYLYNRYSKNFYITINVNDYELSAEVLQSYAQVSNACSKMASSTDRSDAASNAKSFNRIVSKMEGVTSYSEGEETKPFTKW